MTPGYPVRDKAQYPDMVVIQFGGRTMKGYSNRSDWPAQEQLAIKGGRILPIAGPPIDGGIILIRDGKIQAVG